MILQRKTDQRTCPTYPVLSLVINGLVIHSFAQRAMQVAQEGSKDAQNTVQRIPHVSLFHKDIGGSTDVSSRK